VIDWRFVGGLAVLVVMVAAGAWNWLDRFNGGHAGLLAGLGFSFVSLVVGFHWIRWSVTRGHTKFVIAVLGGLAARVVGLLAFALILAFTTNVSVAVALLTIVAAHFVFGAVEIIYLNRTGNLG
jgi:uncharacterized membrane protein YjjP (DUF1212 family)